MIHQQVVGQLQEAWRMHDIHTASILTNGKVLVTGGENSGAGI